MSHLLLIAPFYSELLRPSTVERIKESFDHITIIEDLMQMQFSLEGLHSKNKAEQINAAIGCFGSHDEALSKFNQIQEQLGKLPVILVLDHGNDDDIDSLMEKGTFDVFINPFSLKYFCRSLRRAALLNKKAQGITCGKIIAYEFEYVVTSERLYEQPLGLEIINLLYQDGKIRSNERLKLSLAFQEAMLNALEHGNLELLSEWKTEIDEKGNDRFSTEKEKRLNQKEFGHRRIWIRTTLSENVLTTIIRDEGRGYPKEIQAQRNTDSALAPSGRGMALINWAYDNITFNYKGNEITMKKVLTA